MKTPYKAILFALGCVVFLRVAGRLTELWVSLFLTVVFGLLMDVPVSFLERRGVKRSVGAGTVLFLSLAVVVGALVVAIPMLVSQLHAVVAQHGNLSQMLSQRVEDLAKRVHVNVHIPADKLSAKPLFNAAGGVSTVKSGAKTIGILLFSLFSATWAVANPEPLQLRLLSFLPARGRDQVSEVARRVEQRLRRWLAGQLVLNVAMGLGTYVLLRLVGVPFAGFFAVAAGVLESVPSFGVILANIGPVLFMLVDHPGRVVWLLLGVVVLHQMEDRLIGPYVMGKAVNIPQPLLAFIMLGAGLLFGLWGMVMAVPLAAALFTIHDELRLSRVERDELDGPEERVRTRMLRWLSVPEQRTALAGEDAVASTPTSELTTPTSVQATSESVDEAV